MELRCAYKLHGVVREGVVEVRCKSQLCGAGKGAIILHEFDVHTGHLVRTRKFKDPESLKGDKANGSDRSGISVRSS